MVCMLKQRMVKAQFRPALSMGDHANAIQMYKANPNGPVHAIGFGSWLRHAAHSVGHFITHNPITQGIIKDGASALGGLVGGPAGAAMGRSLAGSLLPSGGGGASAANALKQADPANSGKAPAPTPAPAAAAPAPASAFAGLGVRKRRAAPKKKAAPKKAKKKHARPF